MIGLKQIGLTFKIRRPDPKKVLNRLTEICEKEKVFVDSSLLKKLILETHHDITSCLNILKYVSSNLDYEDAKRSTKNDYELLKVVKESHLFDSESNFRFKKDMLYSIFDSWEKIMKVKSKYDPKLSIPKIKKIVEECDRLEKFNEGFFHNYCRYNYYDENMIKTIALLNSIGDYDLNSEFIGMTQNYSLKEACYLPAANFHMYLSMTEKLCNEYPRIYGELFNAKRENKEALTIIRQGTKNKYEKSSLTADLNADSKVTDSFQTIRLLNQSQILIDVVPYVLKLYRPANLIKQSILDEKQYEQLKSVAALLKMFPIEMIKKLTFDERTRGSKLGLNTLGSKSK